MGVLFARTSEKDRILAIARNGERGLEDDEAEAADTDAPETAAAPDTNPEEADA
jgi:DNA gyrase subunit A